MRYRVLIVEDDHALADVLRMKLDRSGHTVAIAKHQREAYRLLDEQNFNFALLDLRLPSHKDDMDPNTEVGFAILDHIRDRFSSDVLPVIVMTAYEETSQTAVRALKSGANDYIQKPFEDSPISLDQKLAEITRHVETAKKPALAGSGTADKRHKVVFKKGYVEISGIKVTGRSCSLLMLLGSKTLMGTPDAASRDGVPMTGRQIAQALKVQESTIRQYVTRFRKSISDEYKRRKLGTIGKQDIIRNSRDWKGYQINFECTTISVDRS